MSSRTENMSQIWNAKPAEETIAQRIVREAREQRMGFLSDKEIPILAADNHTRLAQCLVRCGACRFVAGAQDVAFLIKAVEAAGDYVRDVALVASR